jgi:hypothetical protein
MAVTVAWDAQVIQVPKSYMPVIQVTPEIRELDMQQLHYDLRELEAGVDGRPYPYTHAHEQEATISGVVFVRKITFSYTVTFEDGAYGVSCKGANSNIFDQLNLNNVAVFPNNSAGLVNNPAPDEYAAEFLNTDRTVHTGPDTVGEALNRIDIDVSSVPAAVWNAARAAYAVAGSMGDFVRRRFKDIYHKQHFDPTAGTVTSYEDDDSTPAHVWDYEDHEGNAVTGQAGSPARRGKVR